jgi:broad specificity phosphatase PhoE
MVLYRAVSFHNGVPHLSNVYLVRHGQAGTRDAYDSLSELGRQQARLLGEYFISQNVEFTVAYSGSMSRQRQTAAEVSTAFAKAARPFPETVVDERWDEFDLARVYRELAPLLCEEDPEFRAELEEMLAEMKQSAGAHDAPVHRRWRPCDTKMVEAWIAGRLKYSGETWTEFCARVTSGKETLDRAPRHANVLIFTSATPTAVLTSLALELPDKRIRQLAGVLYNSSYTVLRQRDDQLRLFQFNAVPHLTQQLLTHR